MDYYKKKNLKFNSEVRREIRHAETVRARESSRFKRLSMLRCIDEDVESFEKRKEKAIPEVKKPVSRLEILHKWKHEKIVKKELEKKNSIRPFYAGVSSLKNMNKGTSKIGKCSQLSGNVSNISTKVPSCNSSLMSRIPSTSKQVASCNSVQTSRIPSCSKQVPFSTTLTSRIQTTSKPFQLGFTAKTTKNTKPQLQRAPSSNQELAKKPTVFGNNPKANQVLLKSKIQTVASSPSSSLNGSSSNKGFQSRIAKPSSVVPRRIPVQSKLPVSNKPTAALSKKFPSVPAVGLKLPSLSSSQKTAPGLIKKPGLVSKVDLKKAPHTLGNQKQGKRNHQAPESSENRSKEPSDVEQIIPEEDNVEPPCSADSKPESGTQGNIESVPDVFDCDVSIIKRPPSFAPDNFRFQAPSEVLDFSFDYSILNKIKEFTSRTSTPSKHPVLETKSDDDDKEIIQKPSKNVDIEIEISTPLKQPAQTSAHDEYEKNTLQTPTKYLDVKSMSTPSKQLVENYESETDKETIPGPSENVDIENNMSPPSKQHVNVHKSDEDDKETMQELPENVDIEDNILTSKLDQDSKRDEDDNEMMQRSSENVKIESDISPPEELVQCSESSPLKTHLQDSDNPSRPTSHRMSAAEEETVLKNWETMKAETEEMMKLPLYEEVDRRKHKETLVSNIFQKRRSILKKSTLNSIAETDDALPLYLVEDAAENKENVFLTPRRSHRISKLISIDESPSTTPRRSLRLQKKTGQNQSDDLTPKGSSHTNLTNDFDLLTLEDFDKMNPDDYLCDVDVSPERMKSRKVSLLYSPDRRRSSVRRSIRGDLMSFSPNNSSPRV